MFRLDRSCLLIVSSLFTCASLHAASTLPVPDPDFSGKISINDKDSTPEWPKPAAAPKDAPNIVLIMTDDTGFGAASTFGGPISTPALEQLAAEGLRYNNFNTTALCSPTRSALLSGRNHHRVGFGTVTEIGSGYPGYNGIWKKSTVPFAEVLRQNGYSTAAFGKWHNTHSREISPVGPFDRWPTGLGFDYFYGFMGGEQNQWEPVLYRNTTPVDPPPATAKQDYHVTTDVVSDAISWLDTHESVTPDKPYFIYLAPGATHAPHHVAQVWIDKYHGKFDQGWDKLREETFARQKRLGVIPQNAKLTPRPKQLPAWNSLKPDEKRLVSRQMEVFAAFLEQTDHEIGRLLTAVRGTAQAQNTLVFYIVGDNGASAEGGLEGSENNVASAFFGLEDDVASQLQHVDELGSVLHDNHYASAWAWGTTTPFQWTKQIASHFGGTRDPLVVAWPARIKDKGGLREQFTHVNDIAATIYEATGIAFPDTVNGIAQQPLDGTSFAYSFDHPQEPTHHHEQYFEMMGNRALYKDGWVAAARHALPWDIRGRSEDFTKDHWELYHVAEDFSEHDDVAAKYPGKLKELQDDFETEARKNGVYPLNNGIKITSGIGAGIPGLADGKTDFTYRAGLPRLPASAAPMLTRSHRITAKVVLADQAEGLIVSDGGRYGGYALYVKDGHLVYENNFMDKAHETIVSSGTLPKGSAELAFEFTKDEGKGFVGGTGRLYVNGELAGEGRLAHVGPPSFLGTFDIGEAHVSPVSTAYAVPYRFNGSIDTVRIQLK